MALLKVEDVHHFYRSGFWMRRSPVLNGISLEVPERSIFGFLGANGAGKTTLIHLMTGIRRPSAGRIWIQGERAGSLKARMKIGYLPERPYFHEHQTGEGLLRFFGRLSGMDSRQLRGAIPKVLATVGLSHAARIEVGKYSKGMLQRIGIAQAILHDPELLILDEPMSGLDPLGRKEIRELMLHLSSEGRTIFFSTHVIPDVEAICDRVALLSKGKIVLSGRIHELLEAGVARTEIGFTGVSEGELNHFPQLESFRRIPEGFRGVVQGEEATSIVLKGLLTRGARVLWAQPVRPSLESYFDLKDGTHESH